MKDFTEVFRICQDTYFFRLFAAEYHQKLKFSFFAFFSPASACCSYFHGCFFALNMIYCAGKNKTAKEKPSRTSSRTLQRTSSSMVVLLSISSETDLVKWLKCITWTSEMSDLTRRMRTSTTLRIEGNHMVESSICHILSSILKVQSHQASSTTRIYTTKSIHLLYMLLQ